MKVKPELAWIVVVAFLALMIPGVGLAQGQGPKRFVGDVGASSLSEPRSHQGQSQTAVSANAPRTVLDNKGSPAAPVRPLKDGDAKAPSVTYVDRETGKTVTKTLPLRSEEFLDYVKNAPPFNPEDLKDPAKREQIRLLAPPQNKLLVVNTEQWNKLSDAEKAAKTIYRTVTRIRRYQVQSPIYEDRRRIGYPCCCWISYSVLVGYSTTWREEVTTTQEAAGADYPTTIVDVDRTIYFEDGKPHYTTRVPPYCQFHPGIDEPLYPTVPLVTDANDKPSTSTGVQTSSESGQVAHSGTDPGLKGDTRTGYILYNGRKTAITDVETIASTPAYDAVETTTVKADVITKTPMADPAKGLPTGPLQDSGQGVATFSGDEAVVPEKLVATPRQESDGTLTFFEARPRGR
jgi:hypothetical protein